MASLVNTFTKADSVNLPNKQLNKQLLKEKEKDFWTKLAMEDCSVNNEPFAADNIKCVTVNSYPQNDSNQKNFMNGLQNAKNILEELQESLKETRKCEEQLMRCRSSHAHSHGISEWWESDQEENYKEFSNTETKLQGNSLLAESWSTMSIVCLQYQYEELAKRYKSLLEAYDERCSAASAKDLELAKERQLATSARDELDGAHRTLLAVGEKYLALRQRKHAQNYWYSKRVFRLRSTVQGLLSAADRARLELDKRLARAMRRVRTGSTALLLAEIRKCNQLCLENLRLKAQIQELAPPANPWDFET